MIEGSRSTITSAPSILGPQAVHVARHAAELRATIVTGRLVTHYRIVLAEYCPEPQECIVDDPVSEGQLKPAQNPRRVRVHVPNANTRPDLEAGRPYEWWIEARNAAGETTTDPLWFETKP